MRSEANEREHAWPVPAMIACDATSGLTVFPDDKILRSEVVSTRVSQLKWYAESDEPWRRAFTADERGVIMVQELLPTYAWHGRHHVAHITRLRERMGWS